MQAQDDGAALAGAGMGHLMCAQCGLDGTVRCGECKAVKYCGTECQRKHWKIHKEVCMPDAFKTLSIRKVSRANMKHAEDDTKMAMRTIMQGLQNAKAARGEDISSLQAFVFRGSELDDVDSLNARMLSEIHMDPFVAAPAPNIPANYCACCGLAATTRCARCNTARYCNKVCQRKHWPVHKQTCVSPPLPWGTDLLHG